MDQLSQETISKIGLERNTFSLREVGITHPDNFGYIKITDSGDIHIMASDDLGIIINKFSRSITFVADTVRFFVKDKGVRINDSVINDSAHKFTEPALLPYDIDDYTTAYHYVTSYLNDDYDYVENDKIEDPNTGLMITREEYISKYGIDPTWDGERYA